MAIFHSEVQLPKGKPLTISTGWWYTYPSEKYELVNWDDDIPNINRKIKVMFQTTTNQVSIQSLLVTINPLLITIISLLITINHQPATIQWQNPRCCVDGGGGGAFSQHLAETFFCLAARRKVSLVS